MRKVQKIKSTLAPLPIDNIDTDQIMPGKYLIWISKDGYDNVLFENWRYEADGSTLKKDFILNRPEYKTAKILVTGSGFGSGSSREHAVWALLQYGFRAVIAPSFHDIFKNNAFGNGLLLVTLDPDIVAELTARAAANPKYSVEIDLLEQKVNTQDGSYNFQIDIFNKNKLINGLDDIEYVLQKTALINKWENKYSEFDVQ